MVRDRRCDRFFIRAWIFGACAAAEDGFLDQLKDRPPILRHYLHPCELSHHREIDAAETQAGDQDVDAITQALVVQGVDGFRERFRTVGVGPAIFHFGVSFFDRHLQRGVGHGKGNELLPVLDPGKAARSLQPLVERGCGQRSEKPEDGESRRPGPNLAQRSFGDADRVLLERVAALLAPRVRKTRPKKVD